MTNPLPGDSAPLPGTSLRYSRDDHGPHGTSTWYTGAGAPAPALGLNGDLYLDTATGDVYQKAAGVWALVTNIAGPAGPAGSQWYTGAGAPAPPPPGVNGDLYLDTVTGDVYQVAGGVWVLTANILGPAGPAGSQWYSGAGAPAPPPPGVNGDMYLDTANGDVYQVAGGVWVLVTNILGPPGPPATPASTVPSERVYGLPEVVGTSTDYSRGDHSHGSPDDDPAEHPIQGLETYNVPGPRSYTVGPTGTYATIKDAMADAAVLDGDTLELEAGTLVQPMGVIAQTDKRLRIIGAGVGVTIVEFPDGVNGGLRFVSPCGGLYLADLTLRQTSPGGAATALLLLDSPGLSEVSCLVERVAFEFEEEAIVGGAATGFTGGWIRHCSFTYVGIVANNGYMIRLTGLASVYVPGAPPTRLRLEDFTIDLALAGNNRIRCLYLTGALGYGGEILCSRWTVTDGGVGALRSIYLQDAWTGMPGGLSMQWSDIDCSAAGDPGGALLFYQAAGSDPSLFLHFVARRVQIQNLSGKGLVGFTGGGPIVGPYSMPRMQLVSNTLDTPSVFKVGWEPAQLPDSGLIGVDTAVFGSHP